MLAAEHHFLLDFKQTLNFGIVVEMALQMLVDGFVHPIFFLLTALFLEVAALAHGFEISVDHFPHLVDVVAIVARIGGDLWCHATWWHGEEVERVAELVGGKVGAVHVVAVALVDADAISHFHNATLDALQFIACAGELNQQEEIHHRVNGGFALAHTHGLDKDIVVAGSLTEHDGFARLASHTAKRSSRG